MKRRYLYGATFEPVEPPAWAACRADRCGGWAFLRKLFPRFFVVDLATAAEGFADASDRMTTATQKLETAWSDFLDAFLDEEQP